MVNLLLFVSVYLTPFLCVALVIKSVKLAKQIKKGDDHTEANTAWVAVLFTLIVYPFILIVVLSLN